LGVSIPTRGNAGAERLRRIVLPLRRFLPECTAGAGAIGVAIAISYEFRWPWYGAILTGLLTAGVALVMYGLAVRAHEADSAVLRTRRLYELTRRTLDLDVHEEPGARLAGLVHEIFELDAVAVFDADLQEVYTAGKWTIAPGELAQNVYHFGTSDDDRSTGISRRVIRLGSVPIGSLVLRGETTPLANSAIAALIAITFDRYRALANESRIEAERDAEQLRSTVLDGLAHDFKTPLTAIRAASTGLAEMGRLSAPQAELVSLIDEQATLLADLTTRLLTTARPAPEEGGETSSAVVLKLAPERVDDLIEEALESLADRAAGTLVKVELPDKSLVVDCDRRLVGMLLAQYLDNACKYGEFDSTITLRGERSGEEVVFSVHSFGSVIPMADRERIFDRYFRSTASSNQVAGTGIGLSVAKRAALAHGGSVWVSSDEAEGNTFYAAIPARNAQPEAFSRTLAFSDRSEEEGSGPVSAAVPQQITALHAADDDLSAGTPALERSIS
jgi:two-component system sensor histidine kinase KdpD